MASKRGKKPVGFRVVSRLKENSQHGKGNCQSQGEGGQGRKRDEDSLGRNINQR